MNLAAGQGDGFIQLMCNKGLVLQVLNRAFSVRDSLVNEANLLIANQFIPDDDEEEEDVGEMEEKEMEQQQQRQYQKGSRAERANGSTHINIISSSSSNSGAVISGCSAVSSALAAQLEPFERYKVPLHSFEECQSEQVPYSLQTNTYMPLS